MTNREHESIQHWSGYARRRMSADQLELIAREKSNASAWDKLFAEPTEVFPAGAEEDLDQINDLDEDYPRA